ncbi:hypothetical protein EAI_00749 [Harpegnathos saltator]|uniref:Uncharacterized protein n=1 Tax=Harpegnathos saltator TaxID=610380 RepID=E2B353_HARSA|nr:hypothetical protein EAI_00749 [Harpegnathos saltator]
MEQIEIEEKRERNLKELKKIRGELFMNIRTALQSMNMMLFCIRQPGKGTKKTGKDVGKDILKEFDDKEDADVLVLLAKITRKISILFNMTNFDLEQEKENKARNLYQIYVSNYNSDLIFKNSEEEQIGLLVEHKMVDTTVPTRADIKFCSKQIIETRLKQE